ncbi:DUF1801 domain-containing protein [Eudoraea chungangensis]|uniref:DUF1801 domain-containing protein n=1 Tax=Eudoraea chungangensis TaxID=1481905 RepID=UPI0023EDE58A|nr:DUF1801 domain-containing protein [Eudoraea chungangensis]
MKSEANSVEQYLKELPKDRLAPMARLRESILENLPPGFEETMNYGMIGYVVPHRIYPEGYHCNPKLPLPFINIASQKNYIALYHMGLYSDPVLMKWWRDNYSKETLGKLDMGKSCVRFKNTSQIPFSLIGELCSKITVKQWIEEYESSRKN